MREKLSPNWKFELEKKMFQMLKYKKLFHVQDKKHFLYERIIDFQ